MLRYPSTSRLAKSVYANYCMEIPVCHTPSTGCRSSMQRRLLSSMLCEPIHARRHTCVFFWKCSRSSCYLQEFCIVSQMSIYSWKAQIQHSTQRCRLQCIRKKSEEKHCFMEAISILLRVRNFCFLLFLPPLFLIVFICHGHQSTFKPSMRRRQSGSKPDTIHIFGIFWPNERGDTNSKII